MKQGLVAFSRYRSSYLFIYTAKMLGISLLLLKAHKGFPGGSSGKESACNVGDSGLNPGLGRSPGGGNGNPLQYSCLENSTDRGAWGAMVHGVAQSQTRLSDLAHTHKLELKESGKALGRNGM